MKTLYLIFLMSMVACTTQKPSSEGSFSDTTTISLSPEAEEIETVTVLTDTTLNGRTVKFYQLTAKTYDSLKNFIRQTQINITQAGDKIHKLDSCFIVKYLNEKTDSLCNWNDGEEYEKYVIKGLWSENNLLLVNFENWEENHDFFINLKDGSYYILTPFYEINPKRDILITYVDIAETPIYESELMITEIQKGTFITLYQKGLGQTTITDAKWISNNECLLTTGLVDIGGSEVKDKKFYRMVIN